jgi:glycolate oxidase
MPSSRPRSTRSPSSPRRTVRRLIPALVLLPRTAEEVAACVQVCAGEGVPFVARGALSLATLLVRVRMSQRP